MSGKTMPSQLCQLLDVLDSVPSTNLRLDGNPWAEPPESIVAKGPKSIRGYFEDLYAEPCRMKRSSIKVVLVGQEGAGKTRKGAGVGQHGSVLLGRDGSMYMSLSTATSSPPPHHHTSAHACIATMLGQSRVLSVTRISHIADAICIGVGCSPNGVVLALAGQCLF
ncbi:unnamed protein product [Ectocarpus sp. 12 AP-2014]